MVKNIKLAIESNPNKTIVVVVGDAHLRAIRDTQLSSKSELNNLADKICRSKYKEM